MTASRLYTVKADPVVGNTALGIIIGSDFSASVTGAYQAFTLTGNSFFCLSYLFVVQFCPDMSMAFSRLASWLRSVWQTTVTPRWFMGQKNLGFHLVDVLSTGSTASGGFHFTSLSFNSKSTGSGSGITATVAALV